VALYPADEQDAVRRTLALESEPVTKLLQESTYREILLRQRINEAAQAVMVAYAIGGDLDQLAANYNVKRLTVTPADNDAVPPVAASWKAMMRCACVFRLRLRDCPLRGRRRPMSFTPKARTGAWQMPAQPARHRRRWCLPY
jgi:phage-related baseplate assembly protein